MGVDGEELSRTREEECDAPDAVQLNGTHVLSRGEVVWIGRTERQVWRRWGIPELERGLVFGELETQAAILENSIMSVEEYHTVV
jgi:hypothetical protein